MEEGEGELVEEGEGELVEEGELVGAVELEATLFASVFLIVQGADCATLIPPTRPLCPLRAALTPPARRVQGIPCAICIFLVYMTASHPLDLILGVFVQTRLM